MVLEIWAILKPTRYFLNESKVFRKFCIIHKKHNAFYLKEESQFEAHPFLLVHRHMKFVFKVNLIGIDGYIFILGLQPWAKIEVENLILHKYLMNMKIFCVD